MDQTADQQVAELNRHLRFRPPCVLCAHRRLEDDVRFVMEAGVFLCATHREDPEA